MKRLRVKVLILIGIFVFLNSDLLAQKRINFAANSDSATIAGRIEANGSLAYKFSAGQGQMLLADITSPNDCVKFQNGETSFMNSTRAGDNFLFLVNTCRNRVDFRFTVLLKNKANDKGDTSNSGKNHLITSNSAGDIRIGLRVADARKAMSDAQFGEYDCECAGDTDSIGISRGGKIMMTLRSDDGETIDGITARDSRYRLENGVHPGMTIAEAEKMYGKASEVSTAYDIESVEFANQPKGLAFIVTGKGDNEAGDYSDWKGGDPREKYASKYTPGAYISAIKVTGVYEEEPESPGTPETTKFTSAFTALKTGCKNVSAEENPEGEENCEGYDSYQINISATPVMNYISAKTLNPESSIDLAGQPFDSNFKDHKVEWRLADGVPFAVILRLNEYRLENGGMTSRKMPGEYLAVKGLKGYEYIDFKVKINGSSNASEEARNLADNAFRNAISESGRKYLINANSVGDIKIGSTIGEVRKVYKGAKFTRDNDEGFDFVQVTNKGVDAGISFRVDYGLNSEPVNDKLEIRGIDINDSRYKTAEGIHVGMTISDAEKKYGKLVWIWTEGLTGDEFAKFSNHPRGVDFIVSPPSRQFNTAGIYGNNRDATAKYVSGAVISSINIPGRYDEENFLDDNSSSELTQCEVATRSGSLNVRSFGRKVIGSLKKGAIVYINEYSNDGRAKVSEYQRGELVELGWVSANYLSCN